MGTRYKKPESVKLLEKLSFESKQRKFPNFPYPVKDMYRDDNANGLTKCVIDWLQLHDCQAERINSMGRQVTIKGHSKWIKGSGTRGTADISAIVFGKSVKIEIKIGKDRQSNEQKAYQQQIEKAGGIYLIVKNFDEFSRWFYEFQHN